VKTKGKLFLIDGSSFCYRAFYAIKNLSTSKGQPTNAIYGVITMLKKLLEEGNPDYVAVAFDLPKPTFRHQRYEGYKGHRKPMPDALVSQIPWIKEVLQAFRIPLFEREGYEADDILGTVASRAVTEGLEVYLVTGDKDAYQLLGPQVKVYRPTRDGYEIIDEEALYERWRLRPTQVVDLMALMGDDVDAIPGVPGIGEKTAVELMQKFGSVEQLLARLKEVPGDSRRAAIQEHQEQLQLSRELAALDMQVPLDLDFAALTRTEPDQEKLRQLFQTLEFRKLLAELSPKASSQAVKITTLASADAITDFVPAIRRSGRLALTVAMSDPHPMQAQVLGVGLCWESGSGILLEGESALEDLKVLWKDSALVKVCPSLKETWVLLDRHGLRMEGACADPSLASYLLDPARPSHRMPGLAQEFFNESVESPDPLQAAALEAEAAFRLMPQLEKEIQEKSLEILFRQVEIPLAEVLAKMELHGIGVDRAELEALSKEMSRTLERLTSEIHALAGEPFNINSPKQLAQILFERLKLPVIKKTKTGASTDEEVLRRLSTIHDLPAKLLEYREMHKLSSTYVEALPKLIDPKTGRLHTSFNQTVTATGRLSSSNPNLQNIPIRTELSRRIRRAFVPCDSTNLFLAADYSQIELRIMAHLSGDERLIEAFCKGEDIHRVTAAEIFHVTPQEVTGDQRSAAKTINFGIIYGMSPFGLSKELGIPPHEAESFIERYFQRYPGVRRYLDQSLAQARAHGYCTTLFSRRRYIPELKAKDIVVRQFAERTAINAPIQGSAADLIKVAMISIDRALAGRRLRSVMILQVHDELIFDVPSAELEPMKKLVKETMEAPMLAGQPIRLEVPIEVKLKIGRNWFEASA